MRKCQYPTGKLNRRSLIFCHRQTRQSELPCFRTFQRNMAQKGVTTQELSILDGNQDCKHCTVKSAAANPQQTKGASGSPVAPTEHHLTAK